MKKQIALVLAGTAATIAGGLRLVQDLVERGEGNHSGHHTEPEGNQEPPAPAAKSSAAAQAQTSSPAPTVEIPESPASGPAGSTGTGRPVAAEAPAGASKAELYQIATELEVSGRSKMSKAELIEAINRAG